MNCKKIFLLFSHKLTDTQVEELKSFGIEKINYLPRDLQFLWSNVPPYEVDLNEYLAPIFNWLFQNARQGDWVLIQGDFGAVCLAVDFCFQNGFLPVYATSKRIANEKMEDGVLIKVSQFKHVMFRKYERWER